MANREEMERIRAAMEGVMRMSNRLIILPFRRGLKRRTIDGPGILLPFSRNPDTDPVILGEEVACLGQGDNVPLRYAAGSEDRSCSRSRRAAAICRSCGQIGRLAKNTGSPRGRASGEGGSAPQFLHGDSKQCDRTYRLPLFALRTGG